MIIYIVLLGIAFLLGFLSGALLVSDLPRNHVSPKRKELEAIVDHLAGNKAGNKDGVQVILPNPVKTAFDEGKINSIDDIVL